MPLLPFVFPVKGASEQRLHGSEPPVARTGKHPWLCSGFKVLPIRKGYYSNTNVDRRFRCFYERATSLLSRAAGGALSPIRVK